MRGSERERDSRVGWYAGQYQPHRQRILTVQLIGMKFEPGEVGELADTRGNRTCAREITTAKIKVK